MQFAWRHAACRGCRGGAVTRHLIVPGNERTGTPLALKHFRQGPAPAVTGRPSCLRSGFAKAAYEAAGLIRAGRARR